VVFVSDQNTPRPVSIGVAESMMRGAYSAGHEIEVSAEHYIECQGDGDYALKLQNTGELVGFLLPENYKDDIELCERLNKLTLRSP